ncbi:MAG: response regulator, partial [Gemmatimonadaceae bacterium]|nr:response regulator [Gemmatimonadaceae bacterium]
QKTLEAFGYRVVVAPNGVEAVAIYTHRRDEIAVVLTDMMMPVMDGAAPVRAVRAMNPDVRIVATSGLMNHLTGTGAGLGVTHFLAKPYAADALLTVLHDCVHNLQCTAAARMAAATVAAR